MGWGKYLGMRQRFLSRYATESMREQMLRELDEITNEVANVEHERVLAQATLAIHRALYALVGDRTGPDETSTEVA